MTGLRNDTQRARARALRAEMAPAERLMWHHLRGHRFLGLSVRRQAPVGPFITDFLIPGQRLIIKIDGGQHDAATDPPRTAALSLRGYRILRFWNNEVLGNLPGCLQRIADEVQP